MAITPTIGRNTNGGREITSKPLSVVVIGVGLADGLALATGEDDGVGESEGVGDGDGEGEAGGSSVKSAHGLGATLAHSLCSPGWSPVNGLMWGALKLPLASATADPATWPGWSQ